MLFSESDWTGNRPGYGLDLGYADASDIALTIH